MNSVIFEAFHVWMTASCGDQFAAAYNVSPVHRDYAKAVRLGMKGMSIRNSTKILSLVIITLRNYSASSDGPLG